MKILITGGSGLLGNSLFKYFTTRGEDVHRYNRNDFSWRHHKININYLLDYDCIIHAAAYTNVEACELHPEKCFRDNTLLTERLAYAASQTTCKFVYVSSTGVYGQAKRFDAYNEYDIVNPTTHHHRAKWLSEVSVNRYANNSLIVRAGWIFGGSPDNPKNFVARRIEEALNSESKEIQSNNEQMGVPTFVDDFAVKLHELIKSDEVGTFNLVNEGSASRYEYVSKIIEFAGIPVKVVPIMASAFPRSAQVSNNETAITLKLQQLDYKVLPPWQDSLERYIKTHLELWLHGKKNNG